MRATGAARATSDSKPSGLRASERRSEREARFQARIPKSIAASASNAAIARFIWPFLAAEKLAGNAETVAIKNQSPARLPPNLRAKRQTDHASNPRLTNLHKGSPTRTGKAANGVYKIAAWGR